PGLEQLGAKEHRVDAAEEEHEQRERQVHRADVLVVRRVDPATPARQGMVVVVMRVVVWVQYGAHFVLLPRFRLPCLDWRFSAPPPGCWAAPGLPVNRCSMHGACR